LLFVCNFLDFKIEKDMFHILDHSSESFPIFKCFSQAFLISYAKSLMILSKLIKSNMLDVLKLLKTVKFRGPLVRNLIEAIGSVQ